VDPGTVEGVLREFCELCSAASCVAEGGVEKARQLLERALGKEAAAKVLEKLAAGLAVPPLDVVRRADPVKLGACLAGERPQVVAVVLAHLPPAQAAQVLEQLPPDKRGEVIWRLATLRRFSPSLLAGLEQYLERRVFSAGGDVAAGGPEVAARVLGGAGRGTESAVLAYLSSRDPELAEEVRRHMFVFEDLAALGDRDLQRVLRHADIYRDLPLALKGVSAELRERFLRVLSADAAEIVRDTMETMGRVPRRDVEAAQRRIVDAARRLEAEGKVVLRRGGEEYVA
jgi:flagellar motor switch protein FliG